MDRGKAVFPTTRRSAVVGAASEDPAERERALEALVTSYWRPVYKYVRFKWGAPDEDARDLTQGFFTRAIEKGTFREYDPARARFRTYLRLCLDGYVANERKAAGRRKRSPGTALLALDFRGAEEELQSTLPDPRMDLEEFFHREWIRSLVGRAVERLREECAARGKEAAFRAFELYDLEEPGETRVTYESLSSTLGLPVTGVTNALAFARRELRRILIESLREITGSEEEFQDEARALFGVEK
jgi:RNA polymerase sigma factor (sigma-70 family)